MNQHYQGERKRSLAQDFGMLGSHFTEAQRTDQTNTCPPSSRNGEEYMYIYLMPTLFHLHKITIQACVEKKKYQNIDYL